MATTTPINGLPTPDDNSPNDPPIHFAALNNVLDSRLVPPFVSAAARDAAITAPKEGQVAYVAAQTNPTIPGRLMLYKASAWRLIGPSPISTIVGPWSESAGAFGTNPTVLTTVTVPDPGFPYVVQIVTACEVGSTQAGTRWDISQKVTGSTTYTHDSTLGVDGAVTLQRITSGVGATVLTGASTVSVIATQAYGAALGSITALNRRLTISVFGAAS